MIYVGGDERLLIVDTRANFEGLIEKICYRLELIKGDQMFVNI